MTSNVFTKEEILKNLATKGYFIDIYTLDTFFEKWKVEAIFENDKNVEFYDKNVIDFIIKNLFNSTELDQDTVVDDSDKTGELEILGEIPDYIKNEYENKDESHQASTEPTSMPFQDKDEEISFEQLCQNQNIDIETNENTHEKNISSETAEILETKDDEINQPALLDENGDNLQNLNEFKLDISQRTLNVIAKTLASKVAKQMNIIFQKDVNSIQKYEEIEKKNQELEKKVKDLETQNKKLKIVLLEYDKKLNSFKPSIFGLYKKVKINNKK